MSEPLPVRLDLNPADLGDNVFRLIGDEWMLITAGTLEGFNSMTASWGALGILWGKQVAFCVVRPQRYTREFLDPATHFTLTFFAERYRPALQLMGSKSGRDLDKVAATGLTPAASPCGSVYYAEARLVLECQKLYYQDIDPATFVVPDLCEQIYPTHDYHRLYVGEIVGCWEHAGE